MSGCKLFLFFLALWTMAPIAAQSWRTPVSGYVYDSEHRGIRTLAGLPGAFYWAADVPIPFKISNALVAGDTALVTNPITEERLFLRWTPGEAPVAHILDSALLAGGAEFSPGGNAVVLFDAETASLQVWMDLLDSPRLSRQASITGIERVSVADDGTLAFSGDAGLLVWKDGDRPLALDSTAGYGPLAFSRDGEHLASFNARTSQASIFNWRTGAAVRRLPADRVEALAFLWNGDLLIGETQRNGKVVGLDGVVTELPFVLTPARSFRVAGPAGAFIENTNDPKRQSFLEFSGEPRLLHVRIGGDRP